MRIVTPTELASGTRASTRWTATASEPVASVVGYYRDPAHHTGWRVEFSAETMLMLVRDQRALGQRGVERLRIQARRVGTGSGAHTYIEYELTRRF